MSPVSWNNLLEEAAASGGGYEPLPDGDYDVVITEATHTQTSTGKLMFKVKMKVESGPHANRIVYNQFVISPDSPVALSIFFNQMRALGLTQEFFAGSPSENQVCAGLVNKRAIVTLTQREYNGQQRNEVKSLKAPAGGNPAVAAAPVAGVPVVDAAAPVAPPVPSSLPTPGAPF